MDYNFRDIEARWQKTWAEEGTYQVSEQTDKPKFYVLNMFPYPSGAGLHVGHHLGYEQKTKAYAIGGVLLLIGAVDTIFRFVV